VAAIDTSTPPGRTTRHDRASVSPPIVSTTRSTSCTTVSNAVVVSSTTSSHPSSRRKATFRGEAVPMTRAPRQRASWTA
jgi:hypothetical protein